MTDGSIVGPKAPLGVGSIISDGFSVLTGNFGKSLVLGFVGAFAGLLVNILFLGFGAATGTEPSSVIDPTTILVGSLLSMLVNLVVYGLITGVIIQLAYDAKLNRSNSVGTYFGAAIPALIPILVLSVVVSILAMIGAIALVIGALWVLAVFYVMVPVAVIEKGGFGSLGRSARLTKEYRWPIVGLFILIAIVSVILQFIGGFLVTLLAGMTSGIVGQLVAGAGMAVIIGLGYALGGIVIALTYARLREIKEGVAVDQIAAVFD